LGENNPKFLELVLNPVVNIFTIKYVQTSTLHLIEEKPVDDKHVGFNDVVLGQH
jgi:hypothetical protein